MVKKWISLGVGSRELKCGLTLANGQCFGWKRVVLDKVDQWIGVIDQSVIGLRDSDEGVSFCSHYDSAGDAKVTKEKLREFFQLDVSMQSLARKWTKKNESDHFSSIVSHMEGMRIVRQDPAECLFSFICSSNNNISRITLMLNRLRSAYGTELLQCSEGIGTFHAFPPVEKLASITEKELRDMGFGYRAKYIVQTASTLRDLGGSKWLHGLRGQPNETIQKSLMTFTGVGPKVADCVALFSLDATGTVPVDTHVWRIACRDFDEDGSLKRAKSVTPKIYAKVGERFRERFGSHAGWAHSLMFAAELPQYRDGLPPKVRDRIVAFAKYEKEVKAARRMERAERRKKTTGESIADARRQKKRKRVQKRSNRNAE